MIFFKRQYIFSAWTKNLNAIGIAKVFFNSKNRLVKL